jgi:hypothetical protein
MSLETVIPGTTHIPSYVNFDTQTISFNVTGTGWSGSGTIYRILSKWNVVDTPIMFLIVIPNLTAPATPGQSNPISLPAELNYSNGFVYFHNDGNSSTIKGAIGLRPQSGSPPYNTFTIATSGISGISNQYAAFFVIGN